MWRLLSLNGAVTDDENVKLRVRLQVGALYFATRVYVIASK